MPVLKDFTAGNISACISTCRKRHLIYTFHLFGNKLWELLCECVYCFICSAIPSWLSRIVCAFDSMSSTTKSIFSKAVFNSVRKKFIFSCLVFSGTLRAVTEAVSDGKMCYWPANYPSFTLVYLQVPLWISWCRFFFVFYDLKYLAFEKLT